MQLHVQRPGSPGPPNPVPAAAAKTPIRRTKRVTTVAAPCSDPGGRRIAGTWRAVSLGADGKPDGLWVYVRDETEILRWTVTYGPTGQTRQFTSLDDARESTDGPLLGQLRGEAYVEAFEADTAEQRRVGQRWLAIHMRLHGHTDVDADCSCGGLLTIATSDGRYAHVDGCAQCRATLPASCPDPEAHRFCGGPDPKLTDLELRMLQFEKQWWTQAGAKATAIRREFAGLSEIGYYAALNRLIDKPAALATSPAVVRRLLRLRDGGRARRRPN